jgi:hypothetical protein
MNPRRKRGKKQYTSQQSDLSGMVWATRGCERISGFGVSGGGIRRAATPRLTEHHVQAAGEAYVIYPSTLPLKSGVRLLPPSTMTYSASRPRAYVQTFYPSTPINPSAASPSQSSSRSTPEPTASSRFDYPLQ